MANIVLRVTPAQLRQKSDEYREIIRSVRTHFETIQELSTKTRGYWIGEAGDRDREGFSSFQDEITYVLGRLEEHPVDLLSMANIYDSTESAVQQKNMELETDLIV